MTLKRLFQAFVFGVSACTGVICLAANDVIHIGELSREEVPVFPVDIVSGSPEMTVLARRAFNMHGSYRFTKPDEAAFVFRLDPVDNSSVKLSIETGSPKKSVFSQTFTGKTWQEAALKACDRAVEKTLGIPGFFNGKVAFVGDRSGAKEIFVADLFFQSVRQVTHDNSRVVAPRWSHDGQKILFTTYFKSGLPDIYMINLATGQRRPFATYEGTNAGAAFSPKDDRVAMILSSSGNPELYLADAEGRSPKRLTHTKSLEASPCWSPDGTCIYLTSDPLGGPQIYKYTLADKSFKVVPTSLSSYSTEPTVNPVHRHLLAYTSTLNKTFQVGYFDEHTGESKYLTEGPGEYLEPCWLHDGRHLLVTHRVGPQKQLYIIDSLTAKRTPLHSPEFGGSSMGSYVYGR